jgi:hypothetical protein
MEMKWPFGLGECNCLFLPGHMSKKEVPAKEGGAYRITEKGSPPSKPLYAGISNDLLRRKKEHKRSGKYNPDRNDFWWKKSKTNADRKCLEHHEGEKISLYCPPLNIAKKGKCK